MKRRLALSAVFGSAVKASAAFWLKSGRQLVVKFATIHSDCCIASRNGLTRFLFAPLATIISESMKPIVPSGGYADLSSGPPASLTRTSVPRFEMPMAASPLAIIVTISLFSAAIWPLYIGSVSDSHDVGGVLILSGL